MPCTWGDERSIKTVYAGHAGQMQPGDVYVLNDPYHGGTHLPDVTVVTPVYMDIGEADPVPPSPLGKAGMGPVSSYAADREPPKNPEPSPSGGGSRPCSRRLTRPPCRHRRHHTGSMRRSRPHRGRGRAVSKPQAGRSRPAARARDAGPAAQRPASVAQPDAKNIADLKAQIAANEKGCRNCARWSRVRPRRRARLHGPRARQRRGVGAPRHHELKNDRSRGRWTRRAHQCRHPRQPDRAQAR